MKKPRIKTMLELSEAIGVSRPTLSRYFQDPGSVRASTSEKIRRELERVEYVPNFFATRMNRKTTGMIGVIIPYLNDLFFTKLLESIEIAAMKAGLTVIVQCSHSDTGIEARAAETFMSMNVDGALVVPLGNDSDLDVYERLNARLPFVLVDSRPETMPGVDFVGSDHVQSTGLMTEYLCRAGDTPVFLAMPRVNFNALERERAYVAKLEQLGLEPHIIGTDLIEPNWHFEIHGLAVMEAHFGQGKLIDRSILCANDRVAIGALRAAARHKIPVGGGSESGLRIAGHDDYPLCPFTTPALTTVAQDVDAIGRASVSLLVEKIQGKKHGTEANIQLFDGTLKVRESA